MQACRRLGVRALTLYAFSEQNWERPRTETEALMGLLREFLISEKDEILAKRIRLRAVGRLQRLPARVREVLDPLTKVTVHHSGLVLSLALSYGGREEIVDAARALAEEVKAGKLDPRDIDESTLAREMASMDVGPVDLLIRTGGEQRLSNFVLWGAAYAELHFSQKLWPDYDETDLFEALAAYQTRERRFGRLPTALETRDEGGDLPLCGTSAQL